MPVLYYTHADMHAPLFRDRWIHMEKIKIGKIVNTVGLKGEVKVYNYSDSIEIYETIESIYV